MNEVEILFKNKALERGGIYLYSKEDAMNFIEECSKRNIIILGIDAFFISANKTQPSLDNSIDFSIQSLTNNLYMVAKRFLESRNEKLFFEIVCAE